MVSELANYLIEQLQKGYSRKQLKEHLLEHGYDSNMIASAFAEITHDYMQKTEPDLQDYVESYISQGYKAEQLYAALKDEGYSKRLLDKTFRQVERKHFSEPEHHPKKRWKKPDAIAIMMVLPIFLFILVLVYLFNSPSGELPLVNDITNITTNSTPKPSFSTTLVTPPSVDTRTADESFTQAIQATNETAALAYCEQVTSTEKQDYCYHYVAEEYDNGATCAQITTDTIRDSCYITFILTGHELFCEQLTLPENQIVCS